MLKMNKYQYRNKIPFLDIPSGCIWSYSSYGNFYLCLQYPRVKVAIEFLLDSEDIIFEEYIGEEISHLILGSIYDENGDPISYLFPADAPELVGELLGIKVYGQGLTYEDIDVVLQRNDKIDSFLKEKN